jgi:hypothetical protein
VTIKWCATCETWWETDDPCWLCGDRGAIATGPTASARSWRNPATWTTEGAAS